MKNRCILHGHVFVMILAGYEDNYKSLDGFKFRQNSTADHMFVDALERLKKTRYNLFSTLASQWGKLVSTLAPSFLIGSSSFLQVMRTTIIAWMNSNFG